MAAEVLENNNKAENNTSSTLTLEEFDYEEETITTTVTKKKKKKVTFSPSILERNSSSHAQRKPTRKAKRRAVSIENTVVTGDDIEMKGASPTKVCVLL